MIFLKLCGANVVQLKRKTLSELLLRGFFVPRRLSVIEPVYGGLRAYLEVEEVLSAVGLEPVCAYFRLPTNGMIFKYLCVFSTL